MVLAEKRQRWLKSQFLLLALIDAKSQNAIWLEAT